jgi:chromosome segregation ATPase
MKQDRGGSGSSSYRGRPWPKDEAVRLLTEQLASHAAGEESRQRELAAVRSELAAVRTELAEAQKRMRELRALSEEQSERNAHLAADLARLQFQLSRGD